MRIIAGTSGTASLYFGDSANIGAAYLSHDNLNHRLNVFAGRVGCNTTSPDARFHAVDDSTGLKTGKFSKNVSSATVPVLEVVQDATDGAQPCLALDQDDVSEGFVDFLGSDRGAVTTALNDGSRIPTVSAASVRVELNGTVYVIPLFADQ